ncbi:MAG: hypothetical protein M3P40_02420 [Actinomycetota bacterium]|nr:hypothetical protein [Actinomycetota bacterium]
MPEEVNGFETLLRQALVPVDPPQELEQQLEDAFGSLVQAAAEELETWELTAMRDPRNWVRPAGAVLVGSGAAFGLVLVRTRRRRHNRRAQSRNVFDLAGRTVRDLGSEVGRLAQEAASRR